MKKCIVIFIFIPSIFLFSSSADAQVLDSTLAYYSSNYKQEKIYLHYDKSAYTPGETVWFKAYLMEGSLPAKGSKTLYIDWVDEKGTLLYHTSAPIVEGISYGQFDVPEDYTNRLVHVTAYTKWMLNFDTAFLYQKTLPIISNSATAKPTAQPKPITSIQFFPEGGDLVAGVINKVAFKATDQWGRPAAVSGVVQKNDVVIDSLKTIHDGMGSFLLVPETGIKHTVKWRDATGNEYSTELPTIKASGVSMQIGILQGKRMFTINRTEDVPEQLKTLYLVGTAQQGLVFKAAINLKDNLSSSGLVPVIDLPNGVVTITLFDKDWHPVAERITFVNNQDYSFLVQMQIKNKGLVNRGKNEIELLLPEGINANLSVSITDAGLRPDSNNNIISQLLLTSELKGKVYHPAYYFKNSSLEIEQQLDLVMLTNGWRRFKWEEVIKGKLPAISHPRDSVHLTLSGTVSGLTATQLEKNQQFILMVKEKNAASKMLVVPLQKDGSFRDPNYLFFDSLQVHYQLNSAPSKAKVNFMTARLAALNYKANNWSSFFYSDTSADYYQAARAEELATILKKYKGQTLEGVTVTARKISRLDSLDKKYTGGLFSGGDAKQFDLLNDPNADTYPDALMYLQGKVAGLQINRITDSYGTPKYQLNWRGGAPIVYINEIPVSDLETELGSLPGAHISYIKVFRPPFMGVRGSSGDPANGAIAIYTKRGGDGVDKNSGTSLPGSKVLGYSPIREFYSPDYSLPEAQNDQPDMRTTLYWKPQVAVGGNENKMKIEFYNSDVQSKAFRVVVEGISKDGRLTHYEGLIK